MALADHLIALVNAIGADIKALGLQIAALGGAPQNVITLTIAPALYDEALVNVIDANVSASQFIRAQLVPNDDFDLDDLIEYVLLAQAKAGSVDFYIYTNGPIVGSFKIAYQILS